MEDNQEHRRRRRRLAGIVPRPILAVTFFALLGLRLSVNAHLTPACLRWAITAALCVCLLSALLIRVKRPGVSVACRVIATAMLYLSLSVGAWVRGAMWAEDRRAASLDAYVDQTVELIGHVSSDPQHYANKTDGTERWRFDFIVDRVRVPPESWQARHANVDVLWFNHTDGLRPVYGPELSIFNTKVRRPRYERAYSSDLRISTGAGDAVMLSEGGGNPILAQCYRARGQAAHSLSIGLGDFPREMGLMHALLLGQRSALDKNITELAVRTGTVHIFAVSGLHLGILVGIIVFILNACRIPRPHWVLLLGPLLMGYTMMVGARSSAVRACIMALIYFAASGVGRRADIPSAVAAAALLIVLWDPGQLFDVGFLFSFVVVLGLIVFCPLLWRFVSPWVTRDELTADFLVERQDRMWLTVRKYVLGLLVVSIAAWMASTPLTAHFFGRVTPIALFGNLVVIPITFMLVLSGSISIVTGSILPLVADIYNHASLVLVTVLVEVLKWMSLIPYGSADVLPWPLWLVYVSYACLAILAVTLYAYMERLEKDT